MTIICRFSLNNYYLKSENIWLQRYRVLCFLYKFVTEGFVD